MTAQALARKNPERNSAKAFHPVLSTVMRLEASCPVPKNMNGIGANINGKKLNRFQKSLESMHDRIIKAKPRAMKKATHPSVTNFLHCGDIESMDRRNMQQLLIN
eukprot:TRINITY_DN1528_c0_g1_i3.p2 TRINITY_DN1528_c0_g1~~TRINITY_DN1528_c0_g1_i3.p2  ORF type:complete len:105 (-),score=25.77 TRINITY_DN1528_c0_g1_i3:50-364(-)